MLPKEVKSMSKQRKMTEKEKKERAKIRKQLREDGLLPPKKKPMNRKKFIDEARKRDLRLKLAKLQRLEQAMAATEKL